MDKLLIICGPTATGKTKLGTQLAKKFNGEIVSADSRQVYKGMDIGTGKDLDKFTIYNLQFTIKNFKIGYYNFGGEKVWLLDIVEPRFRFNVADYKKCADIVLKDIWKRGRLPIIVGGTGFYIKAITEEIGTIGVKPDWKLRDKLQSCKVSELQRMLSDYNPERSRRMNESDKQNPRRLVRAIEVARNSKFQSASWRTNSKSISNFDTIFIGLKSSYETLYRRIDQRVEERIKAGIESEIRGLLKKGYTWQNSALGSTIAYREWKEYFERVGAQNVAPASDETKRDVIQKWKFDEHNYARRQMTWFRKNPKINWFDIAKDNWQAKVEKKVENWYTK